MSRFCYLTGKKTAVGNSRSKSRRAIKRTFRPNLFYRKIKDPVTGEITRVRISAKGLRILKKCGVL